jgi:carbon monoxide dehydrogenase subunit G
VRIEHRFTVSLPVEEAWAVLLDVEGIAPCMPGAEIDDVIEDGFAGTVRVKLGAILATFKGTVRFTEVDEETHRIVLHASGRETKGQGNATADVTAVLTATDGGTEVSIDSDIRITGRIVQFGRGVILDVSAKLIQQFVDCLEDKLASGALVPGEPTA